MGSTAASVVVFACLVVLAVLVLGFGSFARGGAFHARNANKIMQARVAAQFVAVVVIVFLAWAARGGN